MPYLDETGTKALWTKVKGIAANKIVTTSGDDNYSVSLQDKDGNSLSSATLAAASTSAAGVMTKADKAKLDGIAEGATKNTVNNPTITIKQGSVTKGSFTLNQASAGTITVDANTDTHYASSTIVGASATATANAAATNGNVYLNHIENGAVKSAHNIKGTNAVSISSDANGVVTVNAANPGNGTVTIKQAGTSKGSFTMNQSGNTTIELTDSSYTLPAATTSALGGIKVGDNLTIASDGTLSADAQQYTLPTASASVLGGVKVGTNLSISDGVLSAKDTTYSAATSSALGLVKIVTSATSGNTAAITSGAVYTALAKKANLASPTFTGTPAAPTAAAGTNSTQLATTAFVTTAVANAQVGAATFQGTASAETDFSGTAYKKGWYWVVSAAFTFGDNTVEAGDMIFAVSDKGSAYAATDFNVVQTNITAIPTSYIEALN